MNNAQPPSQTSPDLSNTPYDVSMWPVSRPTAEQVPDEAAFATLPDTLLFARLRQYEWVSYGSYKNHLLLGWASASRGLVLIDDSGKRVIVYNFAAVVASPCEHLPACWLMLPDDGLLQQEPVPPQPFDIEELLEAVESWRETVTNCLQLFDDHEDYVDHLMFGREDLEAMSARHPAYKKLPEWAMVLALDRQFRAHAEQAWPVEREGTPPAWTQRYTAWWQRAGWAIYTAIERDFARSSRGIALAKKRADDEAEYRAIVMPSAAQSAQDTSVLGEPDYLDTHKKLPWGIWVMHPTFGAGLVIAHEISQEFGELALIDFPLDAITKIALRYAKLMKWQPATPDDAQTLLRKFGVLAQGHESISFETRSLELATSMRNNLRL